MQFLGALGFLKEQAIFSVLTQEESSKIDQAILRNSLHVKKIDAQSSAGMSEAQEVSSTLEEISSSQRSGFVKEAIMENKIAFAVIDPNWLLASGNNRSVKDFVIEGQRIKCSPVNVDQHFQAFKLEQAMPKIPSYNRIRIKSAAELSHKKFYVDCFNDSTKKSQIISFSVGNLKEEATSQFVLNLKNDSEFSLGAAVFTQNANNEDCLCGLVESYKLGKVIRSEKTETSVHIKVRWLLTESNTKIDHLVLSKALAGSQNESQDIINLKLRFVPYEDTLPVPMWQDIVYLNNQKVLAGPNAAFISFNEITQGIYKLANEEIALPNTDNKISIRKIVPNESISQKLPDVAPTKIGYSADCSDLADEELYVFAKKSYLNELYISTFQIPQSALCADSGYRLSFDVSKRSPVDLKRDIVYSGVFRLAGHHIMLVGILYPEKKHFKLCPFDISMFPILSGK